MVQSRQPLTYRLKESVGLGGPKWHGSSWQRGIAESGSSRLSTLMIDIPGDLVWDLPLYLHVNQKSNYAIIYFAENMWVAFANAKATRIFFSKNISLYAIYNDQSFNDTLINDIVRFKELGLDQDLHCLHYMCLSKMLLMSTTTYNLESK